jgi:hypothetical protein
MMKRRALLAAAMLAAPATAMAQLVGGIAGTKGAREGLVAPFVTPVANDPDALLWQTAVIANGGTVSAARILVINAYIVAEKASGAWALTDDYWGLWAENVPQSLTSLKQRRLATLSPTPPTFTVDQGYVFDGALNYINTGFIPTVNGANMTDTSGRAAVYERTNLNASGIDVGATSSGAGLLLLRARFGNAVRSQIFHAALADFQATSPINDSRGLFVGARSGLVAMAYQRGVHLLPDFTGTLTARVRPTTPLWIGAMDNAGAIQNARAATIGFVSAGGPLSDAQELATWNATQIWATAINANT